MAIPDPVSGPAKQNNIRPGIAGGRLTLTPPMMKFMNALSVGPGGVVVPTTEVFDPNRDWKASRSSPASTIRFPGDSDGTSPIILFGGDEASAIVYKTLERSDGAAAITACTAVSTVAVPTGSTGATWAGVTWESVAMWVSVVVIIPLRDDMRFGSSVSIRPAMSLMTPR